MAGADAYIGKVFENRYRIVRRIGEGGMGAVYEAEHVVVGRRVAVKLLHPDMARDESVVKRFYNEARAAGSVGNEHIIEILDFGWTSVPYLVMEYLQGKSLQEIIATEAPLEPRRACGILLQTLDGLGAAHEKGIVHRDLKPENIFLVRKGDRETVKLLDFGISKLRACDGKAQHLTQTGSILGTPFYMSPEQALGAKDIDGRTDIWSAGVVLYESVVGRLPFAGENYNILLVKIISEPPPKPTEINPHVPHALEEIILKAMAMEREHRFRTCAEFAAAIQAFLDRRPTGVVVPVQSPSETALRVAEAKSKILKTPTRPGAATAPTAAAGAAAPPLAGRAAMTPAGFTAPTAAGQAVAVPTASGALPGRRRLLAPFAGALAVTVTLAVAVWIGFLRGGESRSSPPGGSPPGTMAAPPPAPLPVRDAGIEAPAVSKPAVEPAVPATAGIPASDTILFQVSAKPPQAAVYLDGVEVPGNPVSLRFRKDGVARTIRVAAPGFAEKTWIASFDRDIVVAVSLTPVAAADAASAAPLDAGAGIRQPTDGRTGRIPEAGRPSQDAQGTPPVSTVPAQVSSLRNDAGVPPPSERPGGFRGFREVTVDAGRSRPEAAVPLIPENPYE